MPEPESYEDDFNSDEGEHKDSKPWREIASSEVVLGTAIGGGGVGVVYEGVFESRPVACKTLFDPRVSDNLKREFSDELLAMSQLSHPHIVDFLGACTLPPKLLFVMELCEASLFDLLHRRRRRFEPSELLQMAADVSSALAYLHGRNPAVVHRDLKSHNVLLASSGAVKLCDFGLASGRDVGAGTPQYMPPEALKGRAVGPGADIFALGVLLWEMFAQEIPFDGFEPHEIRDAVLAGARPLVSKVSAAPLSARQIMHRCWAEDPRSRPSAAEIQTVLIATGKELTRATSVVEVEEGSIDALDALITCPRKRSTNHK